MRTCVAKARVACLCDAGSALERAQVGVGDDLRLLVMRALGA
jgi:hypothetical protein